MSNQGVSSQGPVGIVGLQGAGAAIARRLAAKGFRVLAYEQDAAVRRATGAGTPRLEIAGSLVDVSAECRLVLVALADHAAFRFAALGDLDRPGFAPHLPAGSVVVDMGHAWPKDAMKMAALLGRGGIGLVDAPFLGDSRDAEQGRLAILAGGYPDSVEIAMPALEALGAVTRTGRIGTAHATRALTSYVRAACLVATSEALSIGGRLGVEREGLLASLSSLSREAQGSIGGIRRDVRSALALADDLGIAANLLALTSDVLDDAVSGVGDGAASGALHEYVARITAPETDPV